MEQIKSVNKIDNLDGADSADGCNSVASDLRTADKILATTDKTEDSTFSFTHSADWHFGSRFLSMGDLAARCREDMYKAVKVFMADSQKRNFVLLAGDIIEENQIEMSDLEFLRQEFSACQRPIYIVGGNHDPLYSYSPYQKINWSANVYFLPPFFNLSILDIKNFEPVFSQSLENDFSFDQFKDSLSAVKEHVNSGNYVILLSNGFKTTQDFSYILDELKLQRYQACYRECEIYLGEPLSVLGLFHTQVLASPLSWPYKAVLKKDLDALNCSYIALGHIHKAQEVESGRAYYSGSLIGRGFDESFERSYYRLAFSVVDKKINIEKVLSPARQFKLYNIVLQDSMRWEEIQNYVEDFLQDKEAYYELKFKGSIGEEKFLMLKAFLERKNTDLSFLKLKFEDLKYLPSPEEVQGENSLLAYCASLIMEEKKNLVFPNKGNEEKFAFESLIKDRDRAAVKRNLLLNRAFELLFLAINDSL